MVFLHDQGASGITLDSGGSKKVLVLCLDSFVQDAKFRNKIYETKYPTENDWPGSESQRYTL